MSIGLALRHAQHELRSGRTDELGTTLDAVVGDVSATISELRRLARGLPPPQLDAGLGPAFRELSARSPVPVELSAPDERYDRTLEAAAYFIGCEGLTNAIRHAQANRIELSAVRLNGTLVIRVADDGVGGADPGRGSGLRGLADRVEALEGRLGIDSRPGEGTTIRAEIPCA
jgi:signal transduction histidine kinase